MAQSCGRFHTTSRLLVVFFLLATRSLIAQGVVINEVSYKPIQGKSLEFIELYNGASTAVDVSEWRFERGVDFTFDEGVFVEPGGYLVVASDPDLFSALYGLSAGVLHGGYGTADTLDGSTLDNSGETLRLVDERKVIRDELRYGDRFPWPREADGSGLSLQRRCVRARTNSSSNWAAGTPTPGVSNSVIQCPPPVFQSPAVVINEIFYNSPNKADLDEEYVELKNTTNAFVDLSNWQFTDGLEFTIPTGTTIPPGGFVVVAANAAHLRTRGVINVVGNFLGSLSNDGERVELSDALLNPVDVVKYADSGNWPTTADGAGFSLEKILDTAEGFDPASWRSAVGGTTLAEFREVTVSGVAISSEVLIYLVEDGEVLVDEISIRSEDDPEVNYLPGGDFSLLADDWVGSGNHGNSRWMPDGGVGKTSCLRLVSSGDGDSVSNHVKLSTNPELVVGETYTLSLKYKLLAGGESLKVGVLGSGSIDELFVSEDLGVFTQSPGEENTVVLSSLPPFVSRIKDLPTQPDSSDNVLVTCHVSGPEDVSSVELDYVSDSGETGRVTLFDDGAHDDGLSGDRVFGGFLPSFLHGTIVRYSITSADTTGASWTYPQGNEELGKFAFFVNDSQPDSEVPVYYLISGTDINELSCEKYETGTFVSEGKVYLNIGIRNRGDCTRPKRSLKLRFNSDRKFGTRRKINLNSLWSDKSLLREELSWGLIRDCNLPYSKASHVRVHQGSGYHGLFLFIDNVDSDFLERNGLDTGGNLYNALNASEEQQPSISDYQAVYSKRTNDNGDFSDLASFLGELNTVSDSNLLSWIHQNIAVELELDYQTAAVATASTDHLTRNHFLYHDPLTTVWSRIFWDVNLTYGRFFDQENGGSLNDAIEPTRAGLFYGEGTNSMTTRFFEASSPSGGEARYFDRALLGRVWALLREKFNATLTSERVEKLRKRLKDEAEEDLARWGRFVPSPDPTHPDDFHYNVDEILDTGAAVGSGFLVPRISFLENELSTRDFDGFPWVRITEIMYNPAGDGVEFVEIRNTENTPVDISGWYVHPVAYEFPPNTTLGALETVVVTRNPMTFGLMYLGNPVRRFGPYLGKLANGGGSVRLYEWKPGVLPIFPDQHPITIDVVTYSDTLPWPEEADGLGHSLELLHLSYDNDFSKSWRASLSEGGSPGTLNTINLRPIVHLSVEPRVGRAPLDVVLDPLGTRDLDGDGLIVTWDFGDGTVSTGLGVMTHRYENPGVYRPCITVSDGVSRDVDVDVKVEVLAEPSFIRADANDDGGIGIADPLTMLFVMFAGMPIQCEKAADSDSDNVLTLNDPVRTLRYLFLAGPAPAEPFPGCGPDPLLDELVCERQTSCE